jgi:hypothetical protein
MTATLDPLFGSRDRAKLIKLFVFNREAMFTSAEAATRAQVRAAAVRRELNALVKTGLIRRKAKGYMTRPDFPFLVELYQLLIKGAAYDREGIVQRITKLGKIKLIVVTGVFTQTPESRIDLLVVGDGIKTGKLEGTIKTIEAEVGRELRYASLTVADFKYRLGIYDRLVRDVMDYPHEKVLNRLGV